MKPPLIKELENIENYHMNGRDNYFIRSRMLWLIGEFIQPIDDPTCEIRKYKRKK